MKNLEILWLNICQVSLTSKIGQPIEIFSFLMSCNNGDYEFTEAVCNFVNLTFETRSDHLKSVNQII